MNGHQRINPPPLSSSSSSFDGDDSDDDPDQYDWGYVVNNQRLKEITKTKSITEYYEMEQIKWIAHCNKKGEQQHL